MLDDQLRMATKTTDVLIVDNCSCGNSGVWSELSSNAEVSVVDLVRSVTSGIRQACETGPRVVVLAFEGSDLELYSVATNIVTSTRSRCRVIVYAPDPSDDLLENAPLGGISGIVINPEGLITAIKSVAEGRCIYPARA